MKLECVAIDDEPYRRLPPQRHLSLDANDRLPGDGLGGNADTTVLLIEAHGAGARRNAVGKEIAVIQTENLTVTRR